MVNKQKLRRATITITCGGLQPVVIGGQQHQATRLQVSIADDETHNIVNLENVHARIRDTIMIPIWYEDVKGLGAKRNE